MSKSDLTINPTGTTRGRMKSRTFLLAMLAVLVSITGFAAMASEANANVGLGASSGNRSGDAPNPINFGTHPQGNLPQQYTIYYYNDHNQLIGGAQSSSATFTITGSDYRRNGGSCNGTATGTSWTTTLNGSTGFGSGNSCSIILEVVSGAAVGNPTTSTLSYTATRTIEGGNTRTLNTVVQANTYTTDFRNTGNSATIISHDFGQIPTGNPLSYTVVFRNTGNQTVTGTNNISITGSNAGDYSVGAHNCPASLAPGATCNIPVTWTSSVNGPSSASLDVNTSNGGTTSLTLSGEALPPTYIPTLQDTAGTGDIEDYTYPGTTPTGEPLGPEYVFTLRNTGNATLTGTDNQTITGADPSSFVRTTNCGPSLAPNATCSITVRFEPASVGINTATLEVNTTNGGTDTADLEGTATAGVKETKIFDTPGTTELPSYNFPNTVTTGNSSYTFTVQNIGNVNLLNANTRSITGDDASSFSSTTTCGAVLAPNGTCTVTVTFTPLAVENGMVAALNMTPSNGGPSSVNLSGNAIQPSPSVEIRETSGTTEVTSQNVGSANLGSSVAYVFSIRNTGDARLENVAGNQSVTGVHASEFARSTSCGATLLPGASCTITINFSPTRTGVREATLAIAPTNPIVSPTSKSVALSGTGAGVRITNDQANNLTNATQKRWLDTLTLSPGGSVPSDTIRVSFAVDVNPNADIAGVDIGTTTSTNDTAVGGYQNIADLLSGNVTIERKPGSAQAFVRAEVPLSSTALGTGNGQYGFSNGTTIGVCLGGGDYKTDNRRVWFRVRDTNGVSSSPVGSIVRFNNQNYTCPQNQGPQISGPRILSVDGVNQPGGTSQATAAKNAPAVFQFNTRAKVTLDILSQETTSYPVTGMNWRIRNARTGAMFRIVNGVYTQCSEPCIDESNYTQGAKYVFADGAQGQQNMPIPGIPSRGRWIVEGAPQTTSDEDDAHFFGLGVLRVNGDVPNSPNVNFGGTLGPRPNTDSVYTIVANNSDPTDPVNTYDSEGGRAEVIEWDLDGDTDNGPQGDGFELRFESDSATNLPAQFITRNFDTTGKTPGPYTIRVRVTDNGSLMASDNVARQRIYEYTTTINSPAEATEETVEFESDDSQPQQVTFNATDADGDPYRVDITPAGSNDGTLGGNLNDGIGQNTKPYTWPATYTGSDTFDFVATDDKLGQGDTQTLTIRVRPNTQIDSSTITGLLHPDESNPVTRFLGSTTSTDADFTFSSLQNPVVEMECRLLNDGNIVEDWTSCANDDNGSISYSGLEDGLHRVEVRAVNDEGDRDGTPAFRTWRVDNTAPNAEVFQGPPSDLPNQQPRFTNDTTPTYKFRATADERSLQQYMTYECRVMWGPAPGVWYPCGAPSDTNSSAAVNIVNGTPDFGISDPLPEGTYEIQVRATDEVGNLGPAMIEQFTVDTTPPETALASGPEGLINTRDVEFVLGSSQGQSTFLCKLEGVNGGVIFAQAMCPGPNADGSRPTFTGLADDIYTLTATAVDPGTNPDPTPLEVEFEVDATEPTTSMDANVDYGDGPTLLRRTQSRKVDITFTGADTRQLQGFQCRIDSSDENDWQICSSPQRFSGLADGDHVVEIRAKDQAGNVDSTPEVLEWAVDLDPPVSSFTVQPNAVSNDANPSFEFTTNEAISGSVCSLDGAAPVACTSPVTLADLGAPSGVTDGDHQVTVRSTDLAGNVEVAVATATWRQDTVNPEVTFTSKPPAYMPSGDADFAWDVKDDNPLVLAPEAEAECALDPVDPDNVDSGEWVPCDRSLTIASVDNTDGAHTLVVRAIDEAGNVSAPVQWTWNVLIGNPASPVIDDSSPADGETTRVGTAYFAFSHELEGTGGLDGLFCSLDGGVQTRCEFNFGAEGLSDGEHTFSIVAKDIAGNLSAPTTVTWQVQRGAPVTSIDFGPNGMRKQDTASFQFSSDKPGTFECKLDGGAWEACTSPADLTGLADGPHTFSVRAVSSVAPVGVKDPTPPSRNWTVDTVAPDVTIDSAPEGQVVSYQGEVTFSSTDPDAGFQCQVNGGLFDDCSSPFTATGLTAGEATVTVRAVDPAGNLSAEPATATWTVLDPSCGNDFDGTPPNCVAKPEVTGPGLTAESTSGTLSLASLGAVDLPANQIKLEGKRGSDGRWFVPQDGVSFQPVEQVLEDVLGPGTNVTVTISISATGNGWGLLTNGGGVARMKIPVRADVDAKLGSVALFPSGTCSLSPVTFNLVGTWDATAMTASLEQPDVAFPKLTGCGSFKGTIDSLLELPRNDIELGVEMKLTEAEEPVCVPPQTGTYPDCVDPVDPVITIGKPVLKGTKTIKSGKKANYFVKLTNTGDTAATNVKACLTTPKKYVKGKAKRCKTVASIGAGKSVSVKFALKAKKFKLKKTKKIKLRATASYTDGAGAAKTTAAGLYTAKAGKTGSASGK